MDFVLLCLFHPALYRCGYKEAGFGRMAFSVALLLIWVSAHTNETYSTPTPEFEELLQEHSWTMQTGLHASLNRNDLSLNENSGIPKPTVYSTKSRGVPEFMSQSLLPSKKYGPI